MALRFEWDPAKAAANERKHGVAFGLAVRAFADPHHASEQDRIEGGEQRWRTVGLVGGALLVVAHTWREDDGEEIIRIISARRAEPHERRRHARGVG